MRIELDRELKGLHVEIIRMGALIEEAIDNVIMALIKKDVVLAKKIIDNDEVINELEHSIEKQCIKVIARQNPAASDLREIATVLKIITDLERIADHCADISELILDLGKEEYIKELVDIPLMAQMVKKMVKKIIDSYVNKDKEMALAVCNDDDKVDDLFAQIVAELEGFMKTNPSKVHQCVNFIFVAKYFERMADHATNVGEWIVYDITGNHNTYN